MSEQVKKRMGEIDEISELHLILPFRSVEQSNFSSIQGQTTMQIVKLELEAMLSRVGC